MVRITGEGSWKTVENGRRYAVRFRIPPKEPGGKPTWSRQRTFHGTKGECRRQAEAYRAQLEAELNCDPLTKTVGRLARALQDERVALGAVKDRTNQRDEYATRYIELAFGSDDPVDLTPDRITERYAWLMREHGLSASEVIKVNKKLSSILERQRDRGLITSNPAKKATLPHHGPVERQALSTEQFDTLVRALLEEHPSGHRTSLWISLMTGARLGETTGLAWENVDLNARTISFERQYTDARRRESLKRPASVRAISIDDGMTPDLLAEWCRDEEAFFRARGVPFTRESPVCCNDRAGWLMPSSMGHWRRDFFVRCGLGEYLEPTHGTKTGYRRYRGCDQHQLRHTVATRLLDQGLSIRQVAAYLGQDNLETALRYAHVQDRLNVRSAHVMGEAARQAVQGGEDEWGAARCRPPLPAG